MRRTKKSKTRRKMPSHVADRYVELFKRRMRLFNMRSQFKSMGVLAKLSSKYNRIEDLIHKINVDLWVLKNLNEVPMTKSKDDRS